MLAFDQDKSQRLDEEMVSTLSTLLKNQKLIKQKEEKEEFFLNERKVLYNLLMKVNKERRVISFHINYSY